MLFRAAAATLLTSLICLTVTPAHAHFLWLFQKTAENGTGTVVQAHFSEDALQPEKQFTKMIKDLQVWHRPLNGEAQALTVKNVSDVLEVAVPENLDPAHPGVIVADKTFGVSKRGETHFLLQYYAKLYPGSTADAVELGVSKQLRLDIVPVVEGKKLTVNVTWEGKPVADAEVVVKGGGVGGDKLKTDDKGQVTVDLEIPGQLEVRARHVEAKAGKYQDKDYSEVRHYCTVTLPWGETK